MHFLCNEYIGDNFFSQKLVIDRNNKKLREVSSNLNSSSLSESFKLTKY